MTAGFAPDVSFIIAAYNAEETLACTIASALAQEGVSVEVVVVDDCSSDGTRAVARAFDDDRVRLVALERNGGPSAARNAGLAVATGRWVATLDSDDEIRPARLRRMIDLAAAVDAEIAVDNLEVVSPEGHTVMFPEALLRRQPFLTLADFIASNVLFKSTHNFGYMKPVFRRDFLEQHGIRFDESLRIGEDYIFLASTLAHGGRCVVDPQPGYVYHIREGSISRVLKLHHVDAMMAADQAFLAAHALDRRAKAAQRRRDRSLVEARAFLLMVDGIKRRSLPDVLGAAWRTPSAMRLFRLPISARLGRISKRFMRASRPVAVSAAANISNMGGGPHSSKG
jgi:succinoglycan biosynthesis protein ExoO